jgi:repressor LexA
VIIVFYDIFEDLCKEKGVTPNRACIEMGLSRSVAAKWKNTGANPSASIVPKIASYFGVTADYLLGSDQNKKAVTNKGDDDLPSNVIPYSPTGKIPILGQIPAGLAALAVEEIEGYTSVDIHNPEECFALRVKGDSMINAGICPGDLVIIRTQHYADNGQIVACRVNGDEATLKRFNRQGDSVVLMPENSNYEPIIVSCSEFESGYADIIGVAIKIHRDLL